MFFHPHKWGYSQPSEKTISSTGRLVFAKESVYKGRMVKLKNSLHTHMAKALQLRASDKIQGFSVFDKGFQVKSLKEARLYPRLRIFKNTLPYEGG